MKYKIGVFGSSVDEKKAIKKAEELGRELSNHNLIVITGATDGIPYKVASTATCDSGIIISGRCGTLNEFTNQYCHD